MGCPDRFVRNAVFPAANLALLAVTDSKGETSVLDKLHDHANHVLIWKKFQAAGQNAIQSNMPPSDKQIDKKILRVFYQ